MDVQGQRLGQRLALSVAVPSSPLMLIFYSADAFQLVNSSYWRSTHWSKPRPVAEDGGGRVGKRETRDVALALKDFTIQICRLYRWEHL